MAGIEEVGQIYTNARVSFFRVFSLADLAYDHIVTIFVTLYQKMWHIDASNGAQVLDRLFKNAQMCTLTLDAVWPSKADLRDGAT